MRSISLAPRGASAVLLAVLACGTSSTCLAGGPGNVYWIHLERGDSLEARRVEMAENDFVRYRRADGSVGYLPATRVAHIYDSMGSDLRDMVLDHRHPLGGPVKPARSKYRSLAFRGGDKSICGAFLLTETAVLFPIKADAGQEAEQNMYGSVDIGAMANVGRRSAVGASGFWESGTNHNRGGVRLRYRRWLGHRTSIELSPGIVMDGNDMYRAPGFIGQAAINAGDLMSLVVEGEVARYEWPGYLYDRTTGTYQPSGIQHSTDTTFRVGLRAGSYLGFGTTVLAGIGIAVMAATWDNSGML